MDLTDLCDFLSDLGHPTRIRILQEALRQGYITTAHDIFEATPGAHHHLSVLREAGLLVSPQQAGGSGPVHIIYRVDEAKMRRIINALSVTFFQMENEC
jgi:DNA-binding transcriptional ArsR family regulator